MSQREDEAREKNFKTADEVLGEVEEASKDEGLTPLSEASQSTSYVALSGERAVQVTVTVFDEEAEGGERTETVIIRPPRMKNYLAMAGGMVALLVKVNEAGSTELSMSDVVMASQTLLVEDADSVLLILASALPAPFNSTEKLEDVDPASVLELIAAVISVMDMDKLIRSFYTARGPILRGIQRAKQANKETKSAS